MDAPACPACRATDAAPPLDLRRLGLAGRLRGCRRCGHEWRDPAPDAEAALEPYSGAYFDEGYLRYARERAPDYAFLRGVLARHAAGPGRILDVGCGVGFFLEAMRDAGWSGVGVEPAPAAAKLARERAGCPVHEGRLDDADLGEGAFDAVAFLDVLGHVPDPFPVLGRAARLLRPGGLLLVQAPDFGAPWHRLQRARSLAERRDRMHLGTILHRFTPASLAASLPADLRVVETGPRDLAPKGRPSLVRRAAAAVGRRRGRGEEFYAVARRLA